MTDSVNHPAHYTQGDIECIDALKAALGPSGFKQYCRGACIKYLWRTEHKNGLEDLEKCAWYLNRLIEETKTEDLVEYTQLDLGILHP